jgi:hypothetical protein
MTMLKLVEKSTQQYYAIQEKLSEMAALLQEGQTADLVKVQEQWRALNAAAQDTDRQLGALMQDEQPTAEFNAEMEKKRQVMSQIQHQCEKLRQQARTLQVLTADELGRLRKGRKAMGGYRSSNQGAGHSTFGSC